MQIISGTTQLQLNKPSAVAIGKFDGIHLGHRKLLAEILKQKSLGLQAVVFTFDPSPGELFHGRKEKELTTRDEKRQMFERMGIDTLIEFPLTMESAGMLPEVFIEDILVNKLRTAFVAAGTDLSFGKNGAGNSELLLKHAKEFHFEVQIIPKVLYDNREISSTWVRETVAKGDATLAETLLGEKYQIGGKVIHGKQIGRTIGFPTINILPDKNKLLPLNGVYKTKVLMEGTVYESISNVGCKPTITGEDEILLESYLYDFDGNAYDKDATVYFERFMRPEQKFSGIEALKEQLQKDMINGRRTN